MRRKVIPQRGEVWLFDCGMAEKVRPVLILSVPFADSDRAVVTVVFHSTAVRGSQFEVKIHVPFLKDGAFIAQSIATYPTARAIRKLGVLQQSQLRTVESKVYHWLGKTS
jgi:mRNA interferase MazF